MNFKKKCTEELQTDLLFIPTGVFWFFSVTVWHIIFFLFNLLRQTLSDFCVLEKWLVQADWQAFEFPVECEDRSYLWWLSHLFLLDMEFKPYIFILKKRSSISTLLSLGKRHSNMKCQHLCLPVTCVFSKVFDFINLQVALTLKYFIQVWEFGSNLRKMYWLLH